MDIGTINEVSEIWNDFEKRNRQLTPLGNEEFLENSRKNAENRLHNELDNLLKNSTDCDRSSLQKEFDGFRKLFGRFLSENESSIDWNKIEELTPEQLLDYDALPEPSKDAVPAILNKLVVVKLNGGLGTIMGCKGPKSAIPVRNGLTFLDLTIKQIEHLNKTYNVSVPLVFMDSFNTDEDTQEMIRNCDGVEVITFLQNCYPRIYKNTLLPVAKDVNVQDNLSAWYPPGHGDVYETLKSSGLLQRFLEEGREYCFVSNTDNLGGEVDLKILNFLLSSPVEKRHEFLMEVKEKTKADVKGGVLIQYEGRLRLLEIAQVPQNHLHDFKSFKYFNTNNLWIKLDAIDRVVSDGSLSMEVIVNQKTLDNKLDVVQLETASGAAIKCFERGAGMVVRRSSVPPVKNTSDLMLVMSNIYKLQDGHLSMNPKRSLTSIPSIQLDTKYFGKVRDFLQRFPSIPDILELDQLTVSGDVYFGKDVVLKGTVVVDAAQRCRIDIPPGSILEKKLVTGDLRVLDI